MSKHRRTKSSDNYYQKNHEFLVKDDDFEYNETKLIIERIQKMATQTCQIVEKLDDNSLGMYNSMFNFGKQQLKEKSDLNLSQISECSSSLSSERPNRYKNKTVSSPVRIIHSQTLQQTIHYLEQEIVQMKIHQDEMQSVNMLLLQESQKNRQELVRSQKVQGYLYQKNEQMMKQLMDKLGKEQSITNGSTSDGLD